MSKREGNKKLDVSKFEEREFDQRVLDLARVTRVTAGGKRMRFRACVVIGDRKGRVGFSVAKGADVALSVAKAITRAKKHLIKVPLLNDTVPHAVREKFGAAEVLVKPAPRGTGIKAGGAMRVVFELAGLNNVVGKILGTENKITNVKATIAALQKLRLPEKPIVTEEAVVPAKDGSTS